MRPWEREQETPPPDSPPPKPKGSLSSLVVRLSPEGESVDVVGEGDRVEGNERTEPERRVRDEPPPQPLPRSPRMGRLQRVSEGSGFGLSVSPSHRQHTSRLPYAARFDHSEGLNSYREEFRHANDVSRFQDISPTYRRGMSERSHREVSTPYGGGRGRGRFRDRPLPYVRGRGRGRFREPMYGNGRGRGGARFQDFHDTFEREESRGRFINVSPAYNRQRSGGRFHDVSLSIERERDVRRFHDLSPAFVREKNEERYRDISPFGEHGRNARMFGRGFHDMKREPQPLRDKSGVRSNPNISTRTGDWLSKKPICRQYELDPRPQVGHGASSGGPRPRAPQDISLSLDLDPRRKSKGYQSPPPSWPGEDPKAQRESPGHRYGGRFQRSPVPRVRADYHEDFTSRENGKFDSFLIRDWDPRSQGRGRGRQCLDYRNRGNDADQWIQEPRERSRSPRRLQRPLEDQNHPQASFMVRRRNARHGVER